MAAPVPGTAARPAATARLEVTVYQVDMTKGRGAAARCRKTPGLCRHGRGPGRRPWGSAGQTKVLYKVDQQVNLYGDTINVGERTPFVTNSQVTDKGTVNKTIQYQQTGVILKVAPQGVVPDSGGARLGLILCARFRRLARAALRWPPASRPS